LLVSPVSGEGFVGASGGSDGVALALGFGVGRGGGSDGAAAVGDVVVGVAVARAAGVGAGVEAPAVPVAAPPVLGERKCTAPMVATRSRARPMLRPRTSGPLPLDGAGGGPGLGAGCGGPQDAFDTGRA
jgi:hypothetical protein